MAKTLERDDAHEPDGLGEAQERFAVFLTERASDPNLTIEHFARTTPHLEAELKQLFRAWSSARGELAAGSDGARTGDLEFGYEIVEELGSGGFGRVLRARNRGLDTEVAIKVVDGAALSIPDASERFVDEARRLAKVVHENVVRVHDVHEVEHGEDAGKLRLVLELVRGRTLAETVERDGVLSCAEAAQIGIGVCRGLAAIHQRGLLHLDVKPANLMRAVGGRVVLLDFGFAREVVPDTRSAAPMHGGTPPFMAPEHLAGGEVGPAADLYSLGVTLYWCVAGRYPFATDDRGAMFQAIFDGRLVPLLDARPDVDPEFAALIARALTKDPAERFESAGAFEAALRTYASVANEQQVQREARRSTRRGFFVGAAAVVLGGVGAWQLWPQPPAPTFEVRLFEDAGDAPKALARGGQVRGGSWLFLEISKQENCHSLYVFTQNASGEPQRLFPADDGRGGLARSEFLAPTVRAPKVEDGRSGFVELDATPGTESYLVVVSDRRSEWLEALAATVPMPGRSGAEPTEEQLAMAREVLDVIRLRGAQGVVAMSSEVDASRSDLDFSHLPDVVAETEKGVRITTDTFELENTGLF